MPDAAERAVERCVDFHHGDNGRFHRDERHGLPLGEVGPSMRPAAGMATGGRRRARDTAGRC